MGSGKDGLRTWRVAACGLCPGCPNRLSADEESGCFGSGSNPTYPTITLLRTHIFYISLFVKERKRKLPFLFKKKLLYLYMIIKTETVHLLNPEKIITEAICDICGGSCMKGDDTHMEFEALNIKINWGYWSDQKDCEEWTAQICEKCVDKHLVPLIKFQKRDYL